MPSLSEDLADALQPISEAVIDLMDDQDLIDMAHIIKKYLKPKFKEKGKERLEEDELNEVLSSMEEGDYRRFVEIAERYGEIVDRQMDGA